MAHLLVPPERSEGTRGILWWRKHEVEFRSRILKPEQAIGCGIAMFRALAADYPGRRKVRSGSALIVGEVEPTFHAYESFLEQAEAHKEVSAWLLEKVPSFSLSFETPEGEIIRDFDYETVDGERVLLSMRPMDDDEQDAAVDRVKGGLQRMRDEERGG